MSEFDELIEKVDELPLDSQSVFLDIVYKRYNERLREQFNGEVRESIEEYKAGKFTKGNSEDLFKSLEI